MNNKSIDKVLYQFVLIVVSFFGTWFVLSRIEFVNDEDVNKFAEDQEKRLGEFILKSITTTNEEIKSEKINAVLDSIAKRICESSDLDCDELKFHLIRSSEINAFALPDNHIIVYTGLIDYANNAEELAGVLAHEIGHLKKNHITKKLSKEIGMAMLFTVIGGNGSGEVIKEIVKVLSSTAFDRRQETEADLYAVELMARADIDPENLGNILFRLSRTMDIPEELAWINTHPDPKERASVIMKKRKEYQFQSKKIISLAWDDVTKLVNEQE